MTDIELTSYDESWPAAFEQVAAEVRRVLEREVVAVHHIGSTAVPTVFRAKPVIDVLVTVRSIGALDYLTDELAARGFEARGEHGIAGRRYFVRPAQSERLRTNVHVYQVGHPEITRHIEFRDHLRAHPLDARVYSELKRVLADRHRADQARYRAGKDQYIAQIEEHIREQRRRTAAETQYVAGDRIAGGLALVAVACFVSWTVLGLVVRNALAAQPTAGATALWDALGAALLGSWTLLVIPAAIASARALRDVAPRQVLIATGLGVMSLLLWAAAALVRGWPPWLEPWYILLSALWWLGIGAPLRSVHDRLGLLTIVLGCAAALAAMATTFEARLSFWTFTLLGGWKLPLQLAWTIALGLTLWRSPKPLESAKAV